MYQKSDKEPVYAGDEQTPFQLLSAVIVVLCILLTIIFFTIPSAAIPFIILAIVILSPYIFGRRDDGGNDEFH